MSVVVLISDMHGRRGDQQYLSDWAVALSKRSYPAHVVFVDELLPEHYGDPAEPVQERHARITHPDAVALAQGRLAERLAAISPDMALGFSYGGYLLAGTSMPAAHRSMKRLCISATRLRLLQPFLAPPHVHAIFGAEDPNKPDCSSPGKTGPYLQAIDIAGHGHEVYRDVVACAPALDRFLSASPLKSAGPALPL